MSGYNRDKQRQYDSQSPPEDDDMYDETDAEGDVANTLIEAGVVHELVTDVRGALGLLKAVGNLELGVHATAYRNLLAAAEKLERMTINQIEVMTNKGEE